MKKLIISSVAFFTLFTTACSPTIIDESEIANGVTQTYGSGFESAINLLKKGKYRVEDITDIKNDKDGFGYTLKKTITLKANIASDLSTLSNVIDAPIDETIIDDVSLLIAHILSDDSYREKVKVLLSEVIKDKATRNFMNGEGQISIKGDKLVVTITQSLKK